MFYIYQGKFKGYSVGYHCTIGICGCAITFKFYLPDLSISKTMKPVKNIDAIATANKTVVT